MDSYNFSLKEVLINKNILSVRPFLFFIISFFIYFILLIWFHPIFGVSTRYLVFFLYIIIAWNFGTIITVISIPILSVLNSFLVESVNIPIMAIFGSIEHILINSFLIIGFAIIGFFFDLSHVINHQNKNIESQNEELKNLSQIVKHDIRNHINVINMQIDLVKINEDFDYLLKIKHQTQLIQDLVDKSVTLASEGLIIGEKVDSDLKVIFNDVINSLILNNCIIELTNLPIVKCDQIKIRQVFKNLIENALIHSKCSYIHIYTPNAGESKSIRIEFDGKPIPTKIINKLNKREIENHFENSIGLNIILRIIKAHNWKIWFEQSNQIVITIWFK